MGRAAHVRSRRAEDMACLCPAAITCDPMASPGLRRQRKLLFLPCWGPESARGPGGTGGGRGAPPSPPCLTPHPGRSARRRRGIDRPEPELSARSDTISFPLSGSIASTGFQFVFPEIHLPDTFLINPFPHTRDAHRSSTPGPVCGPGTTRLEPLGAAGVFKAAGSPFPHCGPQCQPGGGLGPPTQREPRTREVWAVARAPCRASIL